MKVTSCTIDSVKILTPKKFGDDRGFFSETYNKNTLTDLGIDIDFVQDNHSLSKDVGVLRGLHYQSPPFAQDKLVRVVKGRILDVAVDIRKESPTFGQYIKYELSAEEWNQILVPKGFAHGFITLEPNTEVIYKVSDYYAPDHDHGLAWNDPDLNIDWGISEENVILSEKDQKQPSLAQLRETSPF